jgi:hypothetical protein
MVWFWNSWQEYLDGVNPVLNRNRGHFNNARRRTTLQAVRDMYEAIEGLRKSFSSLQELGFPGKHDERPVEDPNVLSEARSLVIDLISSGEDLLLYNCRLVRATRRMVFSVSTILLNTGRDTLEQDDCSVRLIS